MLVVVGILTVLMSVFLPYAVAVREMSHRAACADNLRQINQALHRYAVDNGSLLPRVVCDERTPNAWTSFTGPDCPDPFLDNAAVRPNDVTASLWLLVRTQHLRPAVFICPSTFDTPEPPSLAADFERRGNFRGPEHLSYSYSSPFSSAAGYRLDDNRSKDFVILGDRNPGRAFGQAADGVEQSLPALNLARGNSLNHRRAGQNVVYASGVIEFVATPFCGAGRTGSTTGDNIYTALRRTPLAGPSVPANEPGFLGEDVAPTWANDSYLVPYEK